MVRIFGIGVCSLRSSVFKFESNKQNVSHIFVQLSAIILLKYLFTNMLQLLVLFLFTVNPLVTQKD